MKTIYFYIIPLIFLALVLLTINIDKKFVGHHDWVNVVHANIARNYARYGLFITKLGQVRNSDYAIPSQFNYVTHYPPLLPITMSVAYKLFGISEVSSRIVPIIISICMVVMLFLIGNELYSKDVGFLSALFVIITPLYIYFGKLPVHETVVPFFSLILLYGYIQLLKTNFKFYAYIMISALVIGGLIIWSNFFMVAAISIYHFLIGKQKKYKLLIVGLFILSIVLVLLHIVHMYLLVGPNILHDFLTIFVDRTNVGTQATIYSFTLAQYLKQEIGYFKAYITNVICLLSFVWILTFIRSVWRRSVMNSDYFMLILFIYGFIYLALFKQAAYIHDFTIYYALPFMALSAAVGLLRIIIIFRNKTLSAGLIFLVVLAISLERRQFTKALLYSDMNQKAYDIARFINTHTKSGEYAYISSDTYKQFYETFIAYYADRQVGYGEQVDPKMIANYQLVIRPKAHDAFDKSSKLYLDTHLKRNENNKYIWYEK